MTDAQTAAHIRQWVARAQRPGVFAWPTDACGYEQHVRFVQHRNANYQGSTVADFDAFVLAYADTLDGGDDGR